MFDGVFIHYLINELSQIKNIRINKVNSINDNEYFFILQNKKKLFFSLNSNNSHIRLTTQDLVNTSKITNLHTNLKKYFESSIIENISQYNNDRIIVISVNSFDELGYKNKINLILEFFGRNANLIITDENYLIIDCLKRLFPNDNDDRIILPKYTYKFPISEKVNPYLANEFMPFNNYEGVSSLCFEELLYHNSFNPLYQEVSPVIMKASKTFFYCFDLKYLNKRETISFNTLSEMLEYFYKTKIDNNNFNAEQEFILNYIKKEIEKTTNKNNKQLLELEKAKDNLKYEQIGNIFASNIYKSKKGDTSIKAIDFYNDNKEITISLNKDLTPNQNLESFFNKYNKAKRAILFINEQLLENDNHIAYLNCLLNQLTISKSNDLKEIYQELGIKQNSNNKVKSKPNYLVYNTKNGDIILVGKNNVQNNYITHKLANKNDYFFHVQNIPGSHTILKTEKLTEDNIKLAATIAAYYSKYREATNVCVDYTLIKNVRKVPGINGSFVTYKNQKSIFVRPDLEYIKEKIKQS